MAASYTNYCARSGGSNLNAGTLTGNTTEPGTSASFTYASGNWVQSTRVFTVASGNPQSDGVAVGDMVSVFADGASETGYVGRVSARSTTTITIDGTANSGSPPTDGTGNRTLRVGGAWAGPSGTSGFPFTLAMSAVLNGSSHPVRINFKNDQTYSITAAVTAANSGARHYAGYASSYGDGGRATLDGGTSGAAYVLLTFGGSVLGTRFSDFVFQNNGASSSAALVASSVSVGMEFKRCVFANSRGNGLTGSSSSLMLTLVECEFYGTNQSNTANQGGAVTSGQINAERCIWHDNTGSNTVGVRVTGAGSSAFHGCIFDTNGNIGLQQTGTGGALLVTSCDFYNHASNGMTAAAAFTRVESCNFALNGTGGTGYGVSSNSTYISVDKCGFGSGTAANATGTTSLTLGDETNSVTYASNTLPWVDAPNGDFRLNLAAAKGAGGGIVH